MRKHVVAAILLVTAAGCMKMAPEPKMARYTRDHLSVCSFNIRFLGLYKKKDCTALASILDDYDIVVVQELVAPPVDGIYPDGETYTADPEAAKFFEAMETRGYAYVLSEEDTGTNDEIHTSSSATEWWVAFYKPQAVQRATDLPGGFLAADRSNHPDYERVPYAFAFRTGDGCLDFVLISVYLQPGDSSSDRTRRKHELASVAAWIGENDAQEKDFIILGDMNIYTSAELADVTPAGYLSLNDECRSTNTMASSPKPYDHVMYNTEYTTEMDTDFDLVVIDLVEAMRGLWIDPNASYPGDPYDHNLCGQYYSDHDPVVFRIRVPTRDDD
jgi:exonuclease III